MYLVLNNNDLLFLFQAHPKTPVRQKQSASNNTAHKADLTKYSSPYYTKESDILQYITMYTHTKNELH